MHASLPKIKNRVAVIAHRGGAKTAPENTLAAFQKAIRVGADYVEIDVRTTRDGQFVLMHDRSVDRTTDGSGAVKDLTLAQIRTLDAGGEKVPTLDEALALCRGKIHVYLDHKEAEIPGLWAAIRRHRMEKRLVVYAGVETLREWKRIAPALPVMPSVPDEYQVVDGIAAFRKVLAAEVLDGHLQEWSADLVTQAHAAGAAVYVDVMGSSDNPDGWAKALALGVDGMQTDDPGALVAFLKTR